MGRVPLLASRVLGLHWEESPVLWRRTAEFTPHSSCPRQKDPLTRDLTFPLRDQSLWHPSQLQSLRLAALRAGPLLLWGPTYPGKGPEALEDGPVASAATQVPCGPREKLRCWCWPWAGEGCGLAPAGLEAPFTALPLLFCRPCLEGPHSSLCL